MLGIKVMYISQLYFGAVSFIHEIGWTKFRHF